MVAANTDPRASGVLALQACSLASGLLFLLQVAAHGLLAHLGHDITRLEVRGLVARDEEQAIAAAALIGRRAG